MRLVPLREVASIQLGKMLSPNAKTGMEPHPYLRNQNVQWGRLDFSDLAAMDFNARERTKFELQNGDLLVCEGGEPGRCAVWRGEVENCYYQKALHRVRLRPDSADSDFLAYWIRFQALTGAFDDQNAKTTIAHLPLVRLGQLLVPALGFQQQRQIAARLKARLAEVETARQAVQVQVQDIALLRSRVLHDAFANLNDLPLTPLADVADIAAGITLGRKTNGFELIEVPYLRVANVQDGHLTLGEIKTVAATGREIEKWTLQDGDLLLTEGGDLDKLGRGACWRNQIPRCIHQNHIFRVRLPKDRYDPDFASFQICSQYGKAYFLAHAKKTTGIASINQRVLGAFPLISPPLDRQRQIASRLEAQLADVEAARQALEAQQVELAALPQRLLSQAFKN